MEKLKPCPWDNIEKDYEHELVVSDEYPHRVTCYCGARGPAMPSKEQAAEAWNKRVDDKLMEEATELLKEIKKRASFNLGEDKNSEEWLIISIIGMVNQFIQKVEE